MAETIWALKEWAIAVEALLTGDLVLLIRKGGIREAKPFFEVPSDRALLFPTYEHQQPEAIRPPYVDGFEAKPVPPVGAAIPLKGWAEITHQLPLAGNNIIESLHPFHIWTDDWLAERLAWKPERPAFALLLRVYRFVEPLSLVYQKQYGGCRSWIELDFGEALPESSPVLPSETYNQAVSKIQQAIAPS
jgi:hypothetical protein